MGALAESIVKDQARRLSSARVEPVGSEGLEPSPIWLRARHAAASTLIPYLCFQSARRESNPRPGPYKRPALTTELRASNRVNSCMGPKGVEPSPHRLKGEYAAVTPQPHLGWAYAFEPRRDAHSCFSVIEHVSLEPVVALRIELSATRLSAEYGQPALDYRLCLFSRDGRNRT